MKLSAIGQRRSWKLLGWAAGPVLVLAAFVQATGTGIDLLVLAAGALILLALERSVGDWLGEWVGPFAAAGIFVVAAVAITWYFLSASLGRSQTDRFFVEAERRGYTTTFYATPRADAPAGTAPASSGGAVATSGAARRSPADGAPDSRLADETGDGGEQAAGRSKAPDERRGGVLSFFRRRSAPAERIATEIAITLEPPRVVSARRTVIRATVRAADGSPVSGNVEFMVNGLGAGRVALDADGVATTAYRTHITGTYEVRARYAGTSAYASSHSRPVTLIVVSGRE